MPLARERVSHFKSIHLSSSKFLLPKHNTKLNDQFLSEALTFPHQHQTTTEWLPSDQRPVRTKTGSHGSKQHHKIGKSGKSGKQLKMLHDFSKT